MPIDRVGVPRIKMSDGPNGVRGSSHFLPTPAQCIPCATALGATFDPEALQRMGAVLAREAKAKGSSLVLGPTINIQRNPLNGRVCSSFVHPFCCSTTNHRVTRPTSRSLRTRSCPATLQRRTSRVCRLMESAQLSSTLSATTKKTSE